MNDAELPRSAVSLVRELFAEVLKKYRRARKELILKAAQGQDVQPQIAALNAEIHAYRVRFREIEANLYSGPNSGR